MNRFLQLAAGAAAVLALGAAAAMGPHGGMMGGMGGMGGGHSHMLSPAMLTRQDAGSAADMAVVRDLFANHAKIRRSVTRLPDGVRTVTESNDPEVARSIQAHVASMSQRLQEGREFNVFSETLPVLFANRDRIVSKVEMTATGAIVTRTSSDPKVAAALQAHAAEVSELAQDGMAAFHRGMMRRMALGGGMMR